MTAKKTKETTTAPAKPAEPVPIVMTVAGATPVSQKAKGVLGLAEIVKNHRKDFPASMIPPHFLIQDLADLESPEWKEHDLAKREEIFVRPCPVTPRHGFVESRPIKSDGNGAIQTGLKSIFLEARAADPQAEMLIAEPVTCKWSAVWTPHYLVFGAGNDGATAGKPFLKLALPGANPFADTQEQYGVKPPDVPFVELLSSHENKLNIVQFRGGPAAGVVGDNFIPYDMTVKRVFHAEGDLLGYEALIKSLKRGDVVYKLGDGLTSHYAAHCVLNKVPYISDHVPIVGESLKETTGGLPDFDIPMLCAGIKDGMNLVVKDGTIGALAKMAVLATHYSQFWRTGDSALALGRFAALLVRISAVLCINESKYIQPVTEDHKKLQQLTKNFPGGRNAVYAGYINKMAGIRRLLRKALDGFMYADWGASFGGKKWGDCAIHAVDLDNLICALLENENNPHVAQKLAAALSAKMHGLINASHNNGKLLTKVLPNNFLDQMADGGTKHALELMMMYAHSIFEDGKSGWLPTDKPAYIPTSEAPSKAEEWWKDGAWVDVNTVLTEPVTTTPALKKPQPVVAAIDIDQFPEDEDEDEDESDTLNQPTVSVEESEAKPIKPAKYVIKPQLRNVQNNNYRLQVWWDLLEQAEYEKKPGKQYKKVLVNKKVPVPASNLPPTFPTNLTPASLKAGYKTVQEWVMQEVKSVKTVNDLAYPIYRENDLTLTSLTPTEKATLKKEATLPSYYSGSSAVYAPLTWKYVDDGQEQIDLFLGEKRICRWSFLTQQIVKTN